MTEKEEIQLEYKFDSVFEFYNSAVQLEDTGNKELFEKHMERNNPDFIGLPKEKILNSKFSYKEGLQELRNISDIDNLALGGSSFKTKWSDFDGDDMDMERLMEGSPFLLMKRRQFGTKKGGKFVTLKVVVSENCFVEAEEMLWKTYTAAKVSDKLEKEGYRLKIIAVVNTTDVGTFKGKYVSGYKVEVTLKEFSSPLNLPLLITCISPWFFRRWVFLFKTAKVNCRSTLGRSIPISENSTKEILIINNQECLSKEGSDYKLKEFEKIIFK